MMEITKADLERRLADLRAQFEKLQANAHALGGAMQDCQYWITIVDGQDATKTDLGEATSGRTSPANQSVSNGAGSKSGQSVLRAGAAETETGTAAKG